MLKVNNIKFCSLKTYSKPLAFKGNIEEDKTQFQILPDELYFIRMDDYRKDYGWAKNMNRVTYELSNMVRNNQDFDEIWEKARDFISIARNDNLHGTIREYLKQFTIGEYGSRGFEYRQKYLDKIGENKKFSPKSNEEYKDANVCEIRGNGPIHVIYGGRNYSDYLKLKNLVKKEYKKLKLNPNPTDKEINRSLATIHWLIAQASPLSRGSDSFANLIVKSIYCAYDMKLTPAKIGISFDFEAFYSDLDEFIEKYPNLFEVPPSRN